MKLFETEVDGQPVLFMMPVARIYICQECGGEIHPKSKGRTHCGHCLGRRGGIVKKGKQPKEIKIRSDGYPYYNRTMLNEEELKLFPSVSGRCILLHRLVMSKHLGRPLMPVEIVRHMDGDRSNYAIENLTIGSYKDNAQDHRGSIMERDRYRLAAQNFLHSMRPVTVLADGSSGTYRVGKESLLDQLIGVLEE